MTRKSNKKPKSLAKSSTGGGYNQRRRSRLKNEIATLKKVKTYLLSGPREEYLKKEKEMIEKRIDNISGSYLTWAQWNATKHKNPRAVFEKEMGLPRMKAQLEQVKMILGEL